jgi:membrane-associated phospholipid phosphatase
MRMVLPILIRKENRLIAGPLLFAAAAILYLASNHFHIFRPRLLPLSRIDMAVPFVPQTVWLYVSEYIYFVVIYWSFRDILNLNKFVYAVFAFLIGCVLVFWLWPTVISRDLFPLPQNLDPLTRLVLTALRRVDSPANCFPSFHVGSVCLSCFIISSEGRWKFRFFLVWAIGICLSTLTLKQHYFVDVVSGLGLAVIFYYAFRAARFEFVPITGQSPGR